MKKICLIAVCLLCLGIASAEEIARDLLSSVDTSGLEAFAGELDTQNVLELLTDEDLPAPEYLISKVSGMLFQAFKQIWSGGGRLVIPVLMLVLMAAVFPDVSGGAKFICRLCLYTEVLMLMKTAVVSAKECLYQTMAFSDVASPVLAGLLTSGGMTGTSALVSPSAAMAGNIIERLFLHCGIPVCCTAVCVSVAGNLGGFIDLGQLSRLLKKGLNWGAGFCVSIFTALVFLKGNTAAVADGVGIRTAKYAVDSASSIIGSGVSDVWDTYLSGLAIARNSLGLTGVVALLSVCLRPMAEILVVMVLLSLTAVFLGMTGENTAGKAFEELNGVCQMLMTLCGGAMSVWVILIGSLMSVGRCL